MTDSRLQIRRVHAQYLVPSDHPAPKRIKERLDDEIKRNLSHVLSTAFCSWFSETDSSLWFVRQLDIDLAVDAAGNGEHVAKTLTRQLGRALGDTLQDGTDHNNVVHFESPAEYLAHFLSDLAAGTAWGRWYYESFFGLRLLPTSGALRTAVCDQPERGRAALLQLQRAELRNVLRALNRQDAQLILKSLTQGGADDEVDCCHMAWSAWQTIEPRSFNELDESRRVLLLYLTASRDQQTTGLNLKRASLSLLRLASRLAADSTTQKDQLLSALTQGTLAEFYQAAGADAEILSPLLRCSPDWLREVAQAMDPRSPKQSSDESATRGRRYTSFGGAFLLLPFIDELPLAKATRNWPHADEVAAISLVRLLLLLKCCGEQNAQRSFNDPLLRDLLVISPTVSVEVIREWQSRLLPSDVEQFLQTLLAWQRTQGTVTGSKQILFRAEEQARPVVVLIDAVRGLWVMVHTYEASYLADVLRDPMAQLESDDGVLLCDPSLLEMLCPQFPSVRMISFQDAGSKENQDSHILAQLDTVSDELAHLALPDDFQLSLDVDLALSLVAQQTMRAFAWRLPGFASSNLRYLWGNFLDFSASLDEEIDRRVVRVGPPPLRLVLGLTGSTRRSYRLSWLDERPLTLFEET